MTAEDLRKSILQQAIQGKLVPQDLNDEPAAVLLERIREEKARLIKEKKIKNDKNESIIFRGDDNSYYEKILATGEVKFIDEEIPFEIPERWEWTRMGCVGDWGSGSTPHRGNQSYYGGNILWLKTGELNNSIVYDTEEKITEKALTECSLRMNKLGDVLMESGLCSVLEHNAYTDALETINVLSFLLKVGGDEIYEKIPRH